MDDSSFPGVRRTIIASHPQYLLPHANFLEGEKFCIPMDAKHKMLEPTKETIELKYDLIYFKSKYK